ncbi:MAG TPA: asparaginase [Polyangiales bacterium]|nr:asparaginase [Polyangiales bacterium]
MTSLFIEQRRGFAVESVHAIDAVSCDASGDVRVLSGLDPLTTFRSASKPFQLEISVELLQERERSQLSGLDLALGAASHHGERFHIEALTRLLTKLGRRQEDLLCGVHPPLNQAAAEARWREGAEPTVLCNNCAGKHTFMAAASAAQDFPGHYTPAEHPLQRAIQERLVQRTAYGIVGTVTDGCGVPCFVLKLSGMARAYASLARETRVRLPSALSAIGRAMREHPLLVSGTEAFDGWVMQNSQLIAKVGATGVLCLAVPDHNLGLAIKVSTAVEAVRPIAVMAILQRYFPGFVGAELPEHWRLIKNHTGEVVGDYVARFED